MGADNFPTIRGFRILRELGRGGSARVYLAESEKDQKQYALKCFHASPLNPEEFRRRIFSELKAAQKANTANAVQIIDLLEQDAQPVLVMEYIDGQSLAEFQARLPYVLPEVSVAIIIEVLKALEQTHREGIIHRDLKPSNILVSKEGRICITDFGLAKLSDASTQTMTGTVLGSPDFMSPEQASGDIVSVTSDLFSLTSILYFLVTGTKPFARSSTLGVLAAVIKGEFEPVQRRNPKISAELAQVIQIGMAHQSKDRYQSASDYRSALEKYLSGIGLSDFSFSNWFAEPSERTMQALRSIAEFLAVEAARSINQQNWNLATLQLAHLSIVAPESTVLRGLLDQLAERKNKKSGIVKYILLPLLLFVFGAIYYFLSLKPDQPKTVAPLAPVAAPIQPAAPQPTQPKVEKQELPQNAFLPEFVSFELPDDIRVQWDGRWVDPKRKLKAFPGTYEIILTKPGYSPIRRVVKVKKGEPTVIRVN